MKKILRSIALIGFVVSPSSLHFQSVATQQITVTNGLKDPAHFEVYADDYESNFSFSPRSFDLAPGKVQSVAVSIKSLPAGTLATNISVLAKATTSGAVAFQAGMKVPVRAESPQTASIGFSSVPLALMVLAVLVAVGLAVTRRRSRGV